MDQSLQEDYVLFCSHKSADIGYLSNWYLCKFNEGGNEFTSVEKYMMYKKAELMGDHTTAERILKNNVPKTLKEFGRGVQNWDQKKWNKHKYEIVLQGCRQKFIQNSDLAMKLLATDNAILAEAAHYDKVWGIGLKADDPDAQDQAKWKGENLLGKALMQIRDELRK